MFTVMFMTKKTTITLRDDVYQTLKETAGARNISNQVNKILIEHFAKTLKVENQELAEKQRIFIKEKSALAPLDESSAVESAKVQTKMKKEIDGWGLADSIVYATALIKKAEVVTGDDHFKKLKNNQHQKEKTKQGEENPN